MRDAGSLRTTSRFAIYRNNVAASLIGILAARFPVVARIVGEESFNDLASRFVALYPPRSPVLLAYGEVFPAFLRSLHSAPAADYLADIAVIEVARGRAYHAADAKPIAAARFSDLTPEQLPDVRVLLHPSLTLLRSKFPVVSVWEANQADADEPVRCWKGEDAMVMRAHYEVTVTRLPDGGFALMSALANGSTLAIAIESGIRASAAFELADNLAVLAGSGVVTGFY